MYQKLEKLNKLCTGCGACYNACPTGAITMKYNMETDGSMVAEINRSKCISCGKCDRVCPLLNKKTNKNEIVKSCYAVWAPDEIREISSSGGIFTILAEYVLEHNGYVCAVAYGDKFKPEHIIISDKNELDKVRRSKYVQSDIGRSYTDIQQLLMEEKYVMLVGTPCQIAGLKSYLEKDYDNLLLVDIYCNYTPPYPLFEKYLNDNFDISDINKIDFRVKKYGWVADIHNVVYDNGEIKERREYNDFFQKGYHPKLFMRKVCEQCEFAGNPRLGDISIADFWYIKDFYPELDDTKGTSCVVLNNDKAKKIFDCIKSRLKMYQEVPIECMKYNRGAVTKANPSRDRFYKLLKEKDFNTAVEWSLNHKYDIAVLGNWTEKNYGSELTYFALYHVLTDMGYEVLMFERPRNAKWNSNEEPVLFRENPYPEDNLLVVNRKQELKKINNMTDTFVIGSDQMWHHDLYKPFGKVSFFDFVDSTHKKIAYATSFGREYWDGTEDEIDLAAEWLSDFDEVSTRESSGVELCKNLFHVKAECVLDPVFLCNINHYEKLISRSQVKHTQPYIGAYILDNNMDKSDLLQRLVGKINLPLSVVSDAFRDVSQEWIIPINSNATIEDWLENIRNANFVITDSFHGMCFAIIFRKNFVAISNEGRGSVRFTDFLKPLGLVDRIIFESDKEIDYSSLLKDIDYDAVYEILNEQKVMSFKWLKNALEKNKESKLQIKDVLKNYVDSVEEDIYGEVDHVEDRVSNHEEVVNRHEEVLNRHEEVVNRHEEVANRHEEVVNRHEEVVNRHEEVVNRHEEVLNRHEEVLNRHEEVVNRHEEVANRHEEVVNRHEEVVNRHEEVVNRHEEVLNRHEEVVNRHEEVLNRHEEVVNRHEEVLNRHEEVVNRHEEVLNHHEDEINIHNQKIDANYEWLKNTVERINAIEEKQAILEGKMETGKLWNKIKRIIRNK